MASWFTICPEFIIVHWDSEKQELLRTGGIMLKRIENGRFRPPQFLLPCEVLISPRYSSNLCFVVTPAFIISYVLIITVRISILLLQFQSWGFDNVSPNAICSLGITSSRPSLSFFLLICLDWLRLHGIEHPSCCNLRRPVTRVILLLPVTHVLSMHTLCLFIYVHFLSKSQSVFETSVVSDLSPSWYMPSRISYIFSIGVLIWDACATAAFFFVLLVNSDVFEFAVHGRTPFNFLSDYHNPAFVVAPLRFCASYRYKRLTTARLVTSLYF